MANLLFPPGDDPGPNFFDLLKRVDGMPPSMATGDTAADHPRHHRRRHPLRRRRRDGRRPAGDLGQPHQPPDDGEGVPRRPPQRRRHRRRGRPGHGHGQAVPAPARALREGRGQPALPRGQGQPAVGVRAQQPAGGDAGPRRRAAVRRLRHPPRARAPVPVRRHRRPLRGVELRHDRVRAACTPARSSSSATARASTARADARPRHLGAVQRRRRGLGHRRPRPRARHLPDDRHDHRRRASSGSTEAEVAERFRVLVDRLSTPESTGQLGAAPTMQQGDA